ncbi:MAG: hypothetical protein P1V20_17445 [Verrucomicrobiales bacterium]|nr:hypothetical protein [Verrucomicrobiales bacterium]
MIKKIIPFSAAFAAAALMISCGESGGDHSHHDHDGHSHDHDKEVATSTKKAGPNGGRILHGIEPHLEFFVTPDRKVQLTALDDSLQPVPMGDQIVRVTAGDRANPLRMSFTKEGQSLVSDISFPDGDDFPIVVQVKANQTGDAVFEKFTLDFSPCPTCDYLEYACTCDHGDEHDHDHKH